ncbi:MAG: hypothetical protein ACP5QG_07515 [candidate division WOR-3 bacterium]
MKRIKSLAAWVTLTVWAGGLGMGCVILHPREDENLKILLDDVEVAYPV